MNTFHSDQLAWLIRRHGIEMTHLSGGSHIGSILSVADIVAVLFAEVLQLNPMQPNWDERDRFILCKGHAGAAIYAALAESGFFPIDELKTHYQNGSRLSGHVSHHLPGVDFSTGALGHGLSAAAGMAYALKKDKRPPRVYAVLGDGECNEGEVWEAVMFANHLRLDNLTAIVDYNHMQAMDFCDNTLEYGDLAARWKAFGWHTIEINGHDHSQLRQAFAEARTIKHRPTVIVANTIKGFGVNFMENDLLWHYRFPHTGWEYECAVNQLHLRKPSNVVDPYTPNGFSAPQQPSPQDLAGGDHTCSLTWHPSYPEPMRRTDHGYIPTL